MTARVGTASRRLTRTVVFALAVCALCALGATNAWAATSSTTTSAPTVVQQLQQGPLLAFTCDDCHAKVSDTLIPGLIFSHGAHMTFDCTACHPRFPHQKGGTDVPTMAACFNCHGLHHGPQGIIANVNADCTTCHVKPRAQHLPADHTAAYSGQAHVAAANADLNGCWLCHTKDQCDACHATQKVSWVTTAAVTYSSGQGCLACHGSQLPRLQAPVTASNLDSSAHRGVACAACHTDFRYDATSTGSKIWQVNAGLACGQPGCHPKEYGVWSQSVHGTAVLSGSDMNAATCGSCHGGHDIMRLDTQAAKDALYLSGTTMCDGACHTHQAAVISYADWWHGSAYKQGSLDAPACWTCHGAHQTTAIKDPASMTSPENLPKTCGQPGCHLGASEAFVESSRTLPHGRPADNTANPVVAFKTNLFSGGR